MSLFAAVSSAANATIDAAFHGRAQVIPRARGAARRDLPGDDAERDSFIVSAGFQPATRNTVVNRANGGGVWGGEMEGGFALVHIPADQMPDGASIADGDRIRLLDEPGQPLFEVSHGIVHAEGRLELRVTPL